MVRMRVSPVKILVVLAVLLFLSGSMSGYTNPVYMLGSDDRVCPGCVKQAREHKNRDLTWSSINPWQTVDNKVVYY